MFDTAVTIIGNAITQPEWRRTTVTGTFVVTFKIASTSRRYDKDKGAWIDGDSLRAKVVCWRKLGENVSMSVQVGDPVIVHGRLYTREWKDDEGNKHTSYEVDAASVGHDLARGVGKFARRRPAGATDVINDDRGPETAGGELTERVGGPRSDDATEADGLFDNFDPELFDSTPISAPDPVSVSDPAERAMAAG